MSKPEISKFNYAMAMFHLKYHYSKIWNEEEIAKWNKVAFDLQTELRHSKPENYDAAIKRILKKELMPLATEVGVRYVREHKIVDGLENLQHIIFENPERPVEVLQTDENTLQITEVKPETAKEEVPATAEAKAE